MTLDTTPRIEQALAHAQFLRAVARGVLGGDAEVEDVLQETFVVAWREGPQKPGSLRAWLATVARRLALDRRRAGKRREQRELVAARPEGLPSPEEIAAREETRRRLVEAVLALDEPYRTTLLWRYYASKTVAEIALLQDVPVDTVRTRLQRGLARLRERLDAQHGGDRRAWAVFLAPLAYGAPAAAAATVVAAVAGGIAVKKVALATIALLLVAVGGVAVATRPGPSESRTKEAVPAAATASETPAPAPNEAPDATLATTSPDRAAGTPAGAAALPFNGRVVDPAGRPVANATVDSIRLFRDEAHTQVSLMGGEGSPIASTTTDAQGRFALDSHAMPFLKGAMGMQVRVTANGFAPSLALLVRDTERDVALLRGGLLVLRVTDEASHAPPETSARVSEGEGDVPLHVSSASLSVVEVAAEAGGRLEVRLVPGRYRARVRAKGLRPIDTDVLVVEEGVTTERVVRLDAGIVAEFLVLDEAGAPVEGAAISGLAPLASGGQATTDAKGRSRLVGLAPPAELRGTAAFEDQRLHYSVAKEGFATFIGWRSLLPGPGTVPIDVRLERGVLVRLRVVEASGAPIAAAQATWVVLPRDRGPLSEKGVVARDVGGVLEMPRIRQGPRRISVGVPDDERFERIWKDLTVGEADMDLTVVLARRDRTISGTVLRADGSPVRSGSIHFEPESIAGTRSFVAASTTTDEAGHFRLEHVRAGKGEVIVTVDGRLAQRFPVEVALDGPAAEITLRLRAGKPIAGRVVDRTATAVADLPVALWRTYERDGSFQQMQEAETRTDANGSFSFAAEDGPEYGIGISNGWVAMQGGPGKVRAGSEGLVIRVKPAAEGHGMPLRLFASSAGAPYEGKLEIAWKVAGSPWSAMELPADGRGGRRFAIWGPPGTYDFSLHAPSHRITVVKGVEMAETPEGKTIEVVLDRGAVVRLRVRDGEGRPIGDTWITANGTPVKTDAGGECESGGWPPGSALTMNVALASDTEYTTARVDVPTTPASVDVTLRRRGRVHARLGIPYGTLGADVVLRLVDARGSVVDERRIEASAVAGWRGEAGTVLLSVADGPHRVLADHGERRAETTVAAEVGRTVEATIVWK